MLLYLSQIEYCDGCRTVQPVHLLSSGHIFMLFKFTQGNNINLSYEVKSQLCRGGGRIDQVPQTLILYVDCYTISKHNKWKSGNSCLSLVKATGCHNYKTWQLTDCGHYTANFFPVIFLLLKLTQYERLTGNPFQQCIDDLLFYFCSTEIHFTEKKICLREIWCTCTNIPVCYEIQPPYWTKKPDWILLADICGHFFKSF